MADKFRFHITAEQWAELRGAASDQTAFLQQRGFNSPAERLAEVIEAVDTAEAEARSRRGKRAFPRNRKVEGPVDA